MKTILLIAGKKGSGKDYIANFIAEKLNPDCVDIFKFADVLKEHITDVTGHSREQIDKLKDDSEYKIKIAGKNLTMREILQQFGDKLRKNFGNDIFINAMIRKIDASDKDMILVPDFRLPLECYKLKTYNMSNNENVVKTLLIQSDMKNDDEHITENALNDFKFDDVFYNDKKNILSNEYIEKIFFDSKYSEVKKLKL